MQVAVLACGPGRMVEQAMALAAKLSTKDCAFHAHRELFEF